MSQKLPVNRFEWIKYTSQFNEGFIRNYNEESDERYFLKLMFNILTKWLNFMMIYCFYMTGKLKIEKVEKLVVNSNKFK